MVNESEQLNVPANGKWQILKSNLTDFSAFEFIAKASGSKNSGKYSITKGSALNVYGKGSIKTQRVSLGYWWNTIVFRWRKHEKGYDLECKTKSDYGEESMIRVYLNSTRIPSK